MGETYQSTIVNAPIDKVWNSIKNFHDLSWSKNVVQKVEPVGEKTGLEVGAKRILNDAFHETLMEVNDSENYFTYSIDDGPSPVSKDDVSNYRGLVKLTSATLDNSTLVEWSSSWENNCEGTAEFCHGIYVALLGDMKSHTF